MDDKSKKQLMQDKINMKMSLLQDTKKLARDREAAMRQQVKMKKEKVRQLERRVAIDSGGTPGREYQKGSFRLYNALMKDLRRDAKGAEQELQAILKENELNIKILEQEIKQLRTEKTLFGGLMKRELVKIAAIATELEILGDIESADQLTKIMKKLAHCGFCEEDEQDEAAIPARKSAPRSAAYILIRHSDVSDSAMLYFGKENGSGDLVAFGKPLSGEYYSSREAEAAAGKLAQNYGLNWDYSVN